MTNPLPLHAAPSRFTGRLHFANELAFIQIAGMNLFPLLLFDPPLDGQVSFPALSQTAAAIAATNQEGDTVTFTGVILSQLINGRTLPVLHITVSGGGQ